MEKMLEDLERDYYDDDEPLIGYSEESETEVDVDEIDDLHSDPEDLDQDELLFFSITRQVIDGFQDAADDLQDESEDLKMELNQMDENIEDQIYESSGDQTDESGIQADESLGKQNFECIWDQSFGNNGDQTDESQTDGSRDHSNEECQLEATQASDDDADKNSEKAEDHFRQLLLFRITYIRFLLRFRNLETVKEKEEVNINQEGDIDCQGIMKRLKRIKRAIRFILNENV